MTVSKQLTTILPLAIILLGLIGFNFINAQVWTGPAATPPNANVRAPINVGVSAATVQNGSGALVFNRFVATNAMWSNQYCDSTGANCWDPTTGPPGGGGDDTITIGGRCFEPAWAVTCNWNWSGDGNDNSTYIRPLSVSPTGVCGSVGRSYQYHTMILAECTAPPVYAWVVGSYSCNAPWAFSCSTTSGRLVRSVSCQNQYGGVGADSLCPGPRPATDGGACSRYGGGSDC